MILQLVCLVPIVFVVVGIFIDTNVPLEDNLEYLLPVLGMVAGGFYGFNYGWGSHGSWLPSPPAWLFDVPLGMFLGFVAGKIINDALAIFRRWRR